MTHPRRSFARPLLVPALLLVASCGSSRREVPLPDDAGTPDQLLCATEGASCAASGCCQAPWNSCLPAGSPSATCVHPDLPPTTGPACNGLASSDLTGVSIEFPDDRCSFSMAEVAAGITIKYTVVVADTLTSVSPAPLDAGHCNQPDPAFGLTPLEKISGPTSDETQRYCLCDVGGCFDPGQPGPVTVVPAGRYDRSMTWTGRNWGGPSDTANPMGVAFPPGTYTFNVTAKGTWVSAADAPGDTPFTVSANRTITITP